MIKVTVIGAGDVFKNRYISAVDALREQYNCTISDVIDVRPAEMIFSELSGKTTNLKICVHQLSDTSTQSLVNLLESQSLPQPFIISTPTIYHVPYANILLKRNLTVCIEKPFAATRQHVDEFDKIIKEVGTDHLFLFGYYLLEKGLAAFVLANQNSEDSKFYLNYLIPKVKIDLINEVRETLGRVQQIRAVLLEGNGLSGSLDHRSWVLDQLARSG